MPTSAPTRSDERALDALRPPTFTVDFLRNADSSVLVEQGGTRIICTASVQDSVPKWLAGKGLGWLTAEYGMLPASTGSRRQRDSSRGKPDGRSVEIQRLIGRSLRSVVQRELLGERMVVVDCDVIDADGGTRCAAISGGYVAVHRLFARLVERGELQAVPLADTIAAISVGIVAGTPMLDLAYVEDSAADVDMNVVGTGDGRLVEVQASAEGALFTRAEFDGLVDLATVGLAEISRAQREACAI